MPSSPPPNGGPRVVRRGLFVRSLEMVWELQWANIGHGKLIVIDMGSGVGIAIAQVGPTMDS